MISRMGLEGGEGLVGGEGSNKPPWAGLGGAEEPRMRVLEEDGDLSLELPTSGSWTGSDEEEEGTSVVAGVASLDGDDGAGAGAGEGGLPLVELISGIWSGSMASKK
jgi:hypothetical protein